MTIEQDFETVRVQLKADDDMYDVEPGLAALSRIEAHFKGWDTFWKERDALNEELGRVSTEYGELHAERNALKAALEYYASWPKDGRIARQALEELEEK